MRSKLTNYKTSKISIKTITESRRVSAILRQSWWLGLSMVWWKCFVGFEYGTEDGRYLSQ